MNGKELSDMVLNLIINGLPSKQEAKSIIASNPSFISVLNLIINGLPSKQCLDYCKEKGYEVLNLIINGLPSKLGKVVDYIVPIAVAF